MGRAEIPQGTKAIHLVSDYRYNQPVDQNFRDSIRDELLFPGQDQVGFEDEPVTIVQPYEDGDDDDIFNRPGTDGTPGTNGTNGTNGTPGTDGTPGADGMPGMDGSDGAPGTPGLGSAIVNGFIVTGALPPSPQSVLDVLIGGVSILAGSYTITAGDVMTFSASPLSNQNLVIA